MDVACCRLCFRRLSKPSEKVGPQGCVFNTLLLADWRQQSQFSSHDTRQVAALSLLRTPSKLFSFTSFAPTGTKAQCAEGERARMITPSVGKVRFVGFWRGLVREDMCRARVRSHTCRCVTKSVAVLENLSVQMIPACIPA